jgi:hypothetical protein
MEVFPPQGFLEFIAPETNRLGFILRYLRGLGLRPEVQESGRARNVFVRFASAAGRAVDYGSRPLCLSAHYDRERRTPGANDNSAACFELLDFCARLVEAPPAAEILVAFTDAEEAASSGGYQAQGSFAFGALLVNELKLEPWVFSLDCCGRGDCLILSSAPYSAFTTNGKPPSIPLLRRLDPPQEWTRAFLGAQFPGAWFEFPTPYSETLGYLAAGVGAVALSTLPKDEALAYKSALAENPIIEHILLKREFRTEAGQSLLRKSLPETWRRLHGNADTPESLDPEAFSLMRRTLEKLKNARLSE